MVHAATCDYTPLENQITALQTENNALKQINSSYWSLLENYSNLDTNYNMLLQNYTKIKSERDYFESMYLNTSLGNMTIGEFITYMNNIENNYILINQSISTQVNQMILIKNWTIGISITLSFALLSVTFIFFQQIKKYILTKFSEITKIKVHNETKINEK
jgi:hypothetical protein